MQIFFSLGKKEIVWGKNKGSRICKMRSPKYYYFIFMLLSKVYYIYSRILFGVEGKVAIRETGIMVHIM